MSVRKSSKIQKLVVNAIRKLQDVQGSTPREIVNYISQEYDVPSTKIQPQVALALARAVSYGILQRSKGSVMFFLNYYFFFSVYVSKHFRR